MSYMWPYTTLVHKPNCVVAVCLGLCGICFLYKSHHKSSEPKAESSSYLLCQPTVENLNVFNFQSYESEKSSTSPHLTG